MLEAATLKYAPMPIRYDAKVSEGDEVKLLALDDKEGLKWIDGKVREGKGSTIFGIEASSAVEAGTPVLDKQNEVIAIVKRSERGTRSWSEAIYVHPLLINFEDEIAACFLNEPQLTIKKDITPTILRVCTLTQSELEAVAQDLVKQPDSWRKLASKFYINQRNIVHKAGDDELARCRLLLANLDSESVLNLKKALINELGLHHTAEALGATEFIFDPFRSRLKLNP